MKDVIALLEGLTQINSLDDRGVLKLKFSVEMGKNKGNPDISKFSESSDYHELMDLIKFGELDEAEAKKREIIKELSK
tara:strand:+ start:117 stop:350 length:234 start_codon:yes stop_codon:yes gene_type:complete